jgi:hypothetical protein
MTNLFNCLNGWDCHSILLQALRNLKWISLIIILVCNFFQLQEAEANNSSEILVTANGFSISRQDLFLFQKMIEQRTHFYSDNPASHLEAAIRTWVFAEEARNLGYEEKFLQLGKKLSENPIERKLQLFFIYRRKLLKDYPLEERMIISFFRSHPELEEPLDETMRERIHAKIVGARTRKIVEDESLVLKAKYNVNIVSKSKEKL